jgi:hypothetical protein
MITYGVCVGSSGVSVFTVAVGVFVRTTFVCDGTTVQSQDSAVFPP